MAVAIRLKREGAKDRPYYRVVVADTRARRDGRYIDVIGHYDPMHDGVYELDLAKADQWIGNGAKPSETVRSLIRKARKAASAAG